MLLVIAGHKQLTCLRNITGLGAIVMNLETNDYFWFTVSQHVSIHTDPFLPTIFPLLTFLALPV